MAPSRRKGTSKAAAAAAACRKWKVGDLVLAKVKGFPPWPATVSEPEKWGYSNDWRKVLVYFFGTQQIAFCNPADVEAFTEEKKESLLKRQGKGADFMRAVKEIVDSYEKLKKQEHEVDGSSGIEVAPTNCGNSVESSSNLQGALAEASDLVSKSSNSKVKDKDEQDKPGGDDAMAVQIDDSKHVTGGHADNGIARETSTLSTYSLRKKSGGPQLERSIAQTQRRTNPVRRSRSSSRVESGRESQVMPYNEDEKIAGSVLSNFVLEGSARKNRRSRETSDVSQGENMGSPNCITNGSMDGHDSEIVTVDSDSISLNEGSAVDSGCKNEQFGTVECTEGDVESRKGLDLQIKAVIRKKRKPNRKRMIHDAVEPASNLENEACSNVAVNNTSQSSDTGCLKINDSFAREDGDEHLPLVKRARVRLGKLLSEEDDGNTVSYVEEKSSNEAIENPSEVGMTSLNPDDGNTVISKADSSNDSLSEDYALSSEHRSQVWKMNLPHVCSADGEAALPPSKRLHRALEAMSANAAEECPLPDGPSLVVQTFTSACHGSSVQTSPHIAFDGKGSDLKQGMPISPVARTPMLPSVLSPNCSQKAAQLDGDFEGQLHKEVIEKVRDAVEKIDTGPSAYVSNVLQPVPTPIQGHLLPREVLVPNFRSSQALPDFLLHADDEADNMYPRTRNSTPRTSPKQADISEGNAVNVQPIAGTEKDDTVSSISGVKVNQQSSEVYGCETVNRWERLDGGGCQANSIHGVSGIIHKQVSEQQDASDPVSILSPTDRQNSSSQASPVNTSICCTSTLVNSKFIQSNGNCTPDANFYQGKPMHDLVDEEEKNESLPYIKLSGKRSESSEAHTALSSFEAVIATLTRTKESIGRATRFAVDCGKFGIAAKVVDVLVRNLERESSLHKRVDLFFLVDSIMQCARGLKGDGTGAGGYASAIQSVLPRLLLAAAPPGSSSQENRRQCLKVLRLWLERKIFSESLIRHHIRELDMMSVSSSGGAYSRRSSRNERSFDDPLREMEGMLVDEYGSNSSFQLPGFCMPRMRKDDDDGSDSDGSFEAVTPEHPCENSREEVASIEKHRHILQDVDGELEMEDVAPSEIEMTSIQSTVNGVQNQQIVEQQFPLSFAPPLLTDVHSSPRFLPSPRHPPPPPPPPPPLPHPTLSESTISDHYVNMTEQSANGSTHGNVGQSLRHQAMPPRIEPAVPGAVHHHAPEYRDHQKQASMSCSPSSYMRRPLNNAPETDGPVFNHKSYSMRPPPPPSNQFSYIQPDQRFRPRRDGPPPHSRHHFPHNRGSGNYYNNHDRMKQPPHEIRENWRFSAPYSGPRYSEKGKNSYPPGPYDGPPCDSPRFQNHGWGCPPRPMNHRNYVPFRPHYEGPGYWRPR